ncbi:MAG: 1-acyl-sn-glycerol-3-phosphate acyltransferase [Actinomycetota bacterium]
MLPPRIVRRLVLAPLMLLATLGLVTTLPVWVIAASAAVPFLPGRWRPLRLLWMLLVYMGYESIGIVLCLGLWIRSGFGVRLRTEAMREEHYRFMAWFVSGMYASAVRVLKLRVEIEERQGRNDLLRSLTRPLLVFSRHAGPGDSFLLVHEVLVRLGRRPRIVLLDLLQLDPCLDIVLNRLPNRFVAPDEGAGDRIVAAIGDLAEDMDERDALLIFPEGANFTERRRLRAIERLRSRGFRRHARDAERMRNVMPPRPGGALAAIAARPQTDIMLVAHTGLEHLSTVHDLWRGLPMDQVVRIGWWIVPEDDLPPSKEERVDWLFSQWGEVDSWIGANRPEVS